MKRIDMDPSFRWDDKIDAFSSSPCSAEAGYEKVDSRKANKIVFSKERIYGDRNVAVPSLGFKDNY